MKSINRILPPHFLEDNSENQHEISQRDDYFFDLKNKRLRHKNPSYDFELKPGGHVPKSGIYLADYFISKFKKDKIDNALEVGVGELAFLPITLIKNKICKRVDGVDVDISALDWAKRNIEINHTNDEIFLYNNLKSLKANSYDLILSNPPQMPVPKNKSLHDDGGTDGYQIIDQVINYSRFHLNNFGHLVLLVFDFLNITKSYNDRPVLINTLQEQGYIVDIKKSIFRPIRPGGKTEQNLGWIKKQYPLYNFNSETTPGYHLMILDAVKIKK